MENYIKNPPGNAYDYEYKDTLFNEFCGNHGAPPIYLIVPAIIIIAGAMARKRKKKVALNQELPNEK